MSNPLSGIQGNMVDSVAFHIEALCQQAKLLGLRLAIQEPEFSLSRKPDVYSMNINYQFLEADQKPTLPGACRVYGPWRN